jgi:hypothetical protein
MKKDLNYYKQNCEENYMTTPLSVLRYITQLEAGYNHAQTEIEELRRDKEEFIDTLVSSIQIIERLIASEKVVNLDEFLGYFKQLITKHNG